MPYIKEGVYPILEQHIRDAYPNTSFPRPMEPHHVADFGYELVHGAAATYDPSKETATEGAPVFTAGQWNQTWIITPKWASLADAQADLKRRVTAMRDQVQFGGADVGGVRIKTDFQSIATLDQAMLFSQRKPYRVFQVKNEVGDHVPMTASQLAGVFDTLGERVALCWDAEKVHYEAIKKLSSIEAALAYDINTGWPT